MRTRFATTIASAIVCILSLFSGVPADAQIPIAPTRLATTFTSDYHIQEGDTSYDGHLITVHGCVLTVDGWHSFAGLTVTGGGSVTCSVGAEDGLELRITGDVLVSSGSYISVGGRGYAAEEGPGAGIQGGTYASGGAHGGYGGRSYVASSSLGDCYGSVDWPTTLGSGGGGNNGARGGGAMHLVVLGTMTVDGVVSANGSSASSSNNAGGGAGGSILLEVGELTGSSSGYLSANGGQNGSGYTGAGGGGRIAVYYDQNTFAGSYYCRTSKRNDNTYLGGAGTVYLKDRAAALADLIISNSGYNGSSTPLPGVTDLAANLTIVSYGQLSTQWVDSGNGYEVGVPLEVDIQGDLTVGSTGYITVGGTGEPAETGPGAGIQGGTYSSGGAHGGYGGRSYVSSSDSGDCYGSVDWPTTLGSGGGGNNGARGGGAMHITVLGTMTVDGIVSANGSSASDSYNAGGGAGGSILLEVGELTGSSSGYLSANGGKNGSGYTGAGGGGRIAVYYDQNTFAGSYYCRTTKRNDNSYLGGAGTVYLKDRAAALGDLTISNSGYNGSSTPLPGVTDLAANLTIVSYGHLSTQWVDSGHGYEIGVPLEVTFQGDLTVGGTGYITVNGTGEPGETGPGAGFVNGSYASGAAHGGLGGCYSDTFGDCYGSVDWPTALGSGGGGTYGARGGGAMHLTVLGTMTVDGVVSATGGSASDSNNAGGGSGGSILLEVGELTGSSSGYLSASGGKNGSGYTGAGGGGRIAVYFDQNTFAGQYYCNTAHRNSNTNHGGAGAVYLKDRAAALGDVFISNAGYSGYSTYLPGPLDLAANMTIHSPCVVSVRHDSLFPSLNPLVLSLDGDLTVASGASINVSNRGYAIGDGPGAGWSAAGTGGGAGYGGDGGNSAQGAAGGQAYGSLLQPVDVGSGGGYPSGGTGGGAMQLTVGGTFNLEGTLKADGSNGSGHGGGGSGGSILVEATELTGFGWIYARGGNGAGQGGGGAGGRISITTDSCAAFEIAHITASGGSGWQGGQTGTVHLGSKIPDVGDIMLSSNDEAWAIASPFPSSLTMQLIDINNGPPLFDSGTWTQVTWRHSDNHTERQFRYLPYGIIDTDGAADEVPAPTNVTPGQEESDTAFQAFPEKLEWTLTQDLSVDFTSAGTYSESTDLTGGTILAGTEVNSHFLHFDTLGTNEVVLQGSVTFDCDILGVIVSAANLDNSDVELGAVGCVYPTGVVERSMELDLTDDYLVLDDDLRTIHFSGRVRDNLDQVRIVTRVPDPQAEPYVSTYDFTPGVNEVTLNNSTTAFYRFTFDLPAGFTAAELVGRALLDDQGVVFLNGYQVSGDMTVSGYDPDPANGPDDPYSVLTDTGKDLTDLYGRRVLTAPTPDCFYTDEVNLFVEGTNELIFGVCADASYWYPTGLEFEAVVNYESPGNPRR